PLGPAAGPDFPPGRYRPSRRPHILNVNPNRPNHPVPPPPPPAAPEPTRPVGRLTWGPPWLAAATHRNHVDALLLTVAALLDVSGFCFFGWRALLSIAAVVTATMTAYLLAGIVIHFFAPRRQHDSTLQVVGMALLMGACLPVMRHLAVPFATGILLG